MRDKTPIFYMVVVLFGTLMPYAFRSVNAIAEIRVLEPASAIREVASLPEVEKRLLNYRIRGEQVTVKR